MFSLDDIKIAVSDSDPAGRDLALTGEILELELLAKPVLTTNMDGKRVANDFSEHEPDWGKLESRCEDLFKVTRDLRVASFYSAALLRTHGFQGFAHGLEVIRRMILASEYRAHPQFDAGDRAVLLERWYTLAALGAPYKQEGDLLRIVEGVRTVPVAKNKSSPCRYLDVVTARNLAGGMDVSTIERLRAEWKKVLVEERVAMSASLTASLGALAEVEAVLLEQTPEDLVPAGVSSKPLHGLVLEINGLLEFLNGSAPQPTMISGAQVGTAALLGEIHSRGDAIRFLQQAADFFRKTEPSSPVPYFVDRAIRLVDRDFMGLLGDLVPDAVPRFQSLTGVEGNNGSRV
jgi:type VI secretion system protein ImpA